MGKKKYDVDESKARRMTPRQIIKEIRKGRTVSGYSDYLDEHYGKDMVRDVPLKEIEKLEKNKGSLWHEGTIKTGRASSIAATARELFSSKKASPPPGRDTWW